MARDRVPVLKRCRSLNLDPIYLGIDKKSKRQNQRANKKMSEYGLQMREKQKAKFIYGVLEKQFRGYYAQAEKIAKKEGIPGENLLMLLEMRLDNVMFRLGQVKVGDVIEVKEKYKTIQRYKDVLAATDGRIVPEWLSANHDALSGTVVAKPTRVQIDVPVEETLIVELYSK